MATSNKIRALNRLPYDFEDGLKVKGIDLSEPGGAAGVIYDTDNMSVQTVLDTVKPIANYSALRAYTGRATQIRITDPGIAGFFYYDAADTVSTDNGGTVIVSSNGKRWKRHYTEAVNLKWFGAKGDVVTDDTSAWHSALDYCSVYNKALFIPDGVYSVNSKKVIDGGVTLFQHIRIFGNGRPNGVASRYLPEKAGPVILTNGQGALEVWFKRFSNESIDIRGVSFVDKATYNSLGRAAVPAIKVKKGNPPETDARYITNNNFVDVAVAGYEDPIVFQGMYPKNEQYSWAWNFIGPTHFTRYYPYECGTGLVLANCTMNRFRMSESLLFGLSSGGIVLREDGDLAPGTGTGGIMFGSFDMVHFEGVKGCFRIPAGLEALIGEKGQLTLKDVTREFCGIYGPFGPNGFYLGTPYGIGSATDIIVQGRCDRDIAYGETERVLLAAGCSISSEMPLLVKALDPSNINILTPETINYIDEKYSVLPGSTLIKDIRLAEGAGVNFDCNFEVIVEGGAYGVKRLHTYGRTGGVIQRFETAAMGDGGANVVFSNGSVAADIVNIAMSNVTIYTLTFRVRMTTRSGIQTYAA